MKRCSKCGYETTRDLNGNHTVGSRLIENMQYLGWSWCPFCVDKFAEKYPALWATQVGKMEPVE